MDVTGHRRRRAPAARAVGVLAGLTGLVALTALSGCGPEAGVADQEPFDLLVRGGTVYDGSGDPPRRADVGVRGDRIAAVGDLGNAAARQVLEADGLAVAPGFINAHSWATGSLLRDGRSMSDLKQGVTTEVFGEGVTMGPLNDRLREWLATERDPDFPPPGYDIEWTTLRDYLGHLEREGVTPNVASFVGATTVRQHVLGDADVQPGSGELERMRELVRGEMELGALGVGSRLAYAPASYASTRELTALAEVAARFGGRYISHIRSEGDRLLESVQELVTIAREADAPATIYHLKAAGQPNWTKQDSVIAMVEAARAGGLDLTATMYTYRAGSTGLDACLPRWAHAGGPDSLRSRLRDPDARARMAEDMRADDAGYENYCRLSGSPENVLLVEFRQDSLKRYQGMSLAEVASRRDTDPVTTTMDLVLQDESLVQTVYFLMSEENVRELIRLPWVFFGSDGPSVAAEGAFLEARVHPRAYGTFARLLGRYVREEGLLPLEEAIRRLTSFPARQLGLAGRGRIVEGSFADLVVFDPARIEDRADYENPHRYAVGVRDVVVNGTVVLREGEHTGAHPGRALERAPREAGLAGGGLPDGR